MKTFTFLFFCLILLSCSKGSKDSKMSVTISGISAGVSNYTGMMLYGVNKLKGEKFATKISGPTTYTFAANVGEKWDFYVYAWVESNPLEGSPSCAVALDKVLVDGPNTIDLQLTTDCKNSTHYHPNAYYNSTYEVPRINLCPPGTVAGDLLSCNITSSQATGVRVILTQHVQRKFETNFSQDTEALSSICKPINTGAGYLNNLFIPTPETKTDFPVGMKFKVYYGSSSCTGEACCSGREENFHFDRGYKISSTEKVAIQPNSAGMGFGLRIAEKGGDFKASIIAPDINNMTYNTCYLAYVSLKDSNTNVYTTAPVNQNFVVKCKSCEFHTTGNCSGGALPEYNVSIAAGTTTSTVFYVKAKGAAASLFTSGNSQSAGDNTGIYPVKINAADLDETYARSFMDYAYVLYNMPFPSIMYDGANTFVTYPQYYAFRSNVSSSAGCSTNCDDYHNYGYFLVKDFNPSMMTLTYDYKTFDNNLLYRSGSNMVFDYSTSAQCLDFELTNPQATSVPYANDACVQTNIAPYHYFNVQGNYSSAGGALFAIPNHLVIP